MERKNKAPQYSSKGAEEFDLAWKEFFKDKPRAKNDNPEKKQMEEFIHWYNYVRKQSDTGKTPDEMFKEIYGKEPEGNLRVDSRKMNFEWDKDYKEPDDLIIEANHLLDKNKFNDALEKVNEFLEMVKDDEEAILLKAEILNNLDRFDEAENCLKKIKREGYKAYVSFYKSQRFMFEGNIVRASKYMKEAYEQEPDNFDFVIGLANYLYFEGDKYYKEYIEKARTIDKRRTERFLKKSWIKIKDLIGGPFVMGSLGCIHDLMEGDNFEEAEKNLLFLLNYEKHIDGEFIKMTRGLEVECLIAQEKLDKAYTKVEELIKFDNKNPHAYFYKAQLLFQKEDLNNALNEIDKCLEIAERKIPHYDFYLLKSMILKEMDNDEYIYYENKGKALRKEASKIQNFMDDLMNDR